ncbi:MAG: sigma-70 family RNA polymerase sigma factor [Saprospiraceae bacterium]|nr:sigma-70 family RNA polymerase sigma factor [Saprospiraceae bacterium]
MLEHVLLEYRPRVVKQVCAQGGSEEEAKDIFQEALVAIYRKTQQSEFQLTSSFYTFLYAICHNHWLKKCREKKRHNEVRLEDHGVSMTAEATETFEQSERYQLYISKFKQLGEECQKVLRLSIIEEKSPDEIIAMLGFGSVGYLYKRKSNCKDKLFDLIHQDASFKKLKSWYNQSNTSR